MFCERTLNFLASALTQLCERFNTWLHKKLGCLARQTSDVSSSSSVQLFSASCCCSRRPYSQSKRASWDASFPPVILSLHNQRDDGIRSSPLTLRSVWTTAHTEYTPSRTHKIPTLDPLSSPAELSSTSCEATRSFVGPPVWLYLSGASYSSLSSARSQAWCYPQPPWFCLNPACNEAVWRQITQNTSWSLGGADEDFQQDGSWRWFAFMSACCEKWPS